MNWFYSLEKNISQENKNYQAIRLYRKAIYLVTLFISFQYLINKEFFFGVNSAVGEAYVRSHSLDFIFQLLQFEWFQNSEIVFLVALVVSSFLGMVGLFKRITAIVTFLFYINITLYLSHITNAGQQLLYILLFYNVFLSEKKDDGYYGNILSNLATFGSKIQIVLLYFTAGLLKLTGEFWLNGTAMQFMVNIPEYSHPIVLEAFQTLPWLTYPFTWFALTYQLMFSILVWFRKIKYKLFILGLFFHLGIAFINGIMDFGLIMICSYLIFYDEERSNQILDWFDSLSKKAGIKNMIKSGD